MLALERCVIEMEKAGRCSNMLGVLVSMLLVCNCLAYQIQKQDFVA